MYVKITFDIFHPTKLDYLAGSDTFFIYSFEILIINCKYQEEKKVLIRFGKDGVFIMKEDFKLAPKSLSSCDLFLFFFVLSG